MFSKLLQIWDDLRSSYWFIPSIMALGAILSALFLTQSHWVLNLTILDNSPWLYKSTPEGARQVMATIAGSMISVASVTFSITIASVAYATSQFGPRLITNFMSDRGNQITLGTFIATFLYCLMVLRTLTGTNGTSGTDAVPQLAVAGGVMFGVASIGVLIYFIHHVPASIHASNVIGGVGQQLLDQVKRLYPKPSEDQVSKEPPQLDISTDLAQAQVVRSNCDGIVQFVDKPTLVDLAKEQGAAVVLDVRPGDFIHSGSYLGWVLHSNPLDDEATDCFRSAFLLGDKRTAAQDVMFLAKELVEIAARALSSGVNDPFTAINCMDWLASAITVVAIGQPPESNVFADDGSLLLVAKPISQQDFIEHNLSMMRVYAARDRNAALHFQLLLGGVLLQDIRSPMRLLLMNQSSDLITCAKDSLNPLDIKQLQQRHEILAEIKPNSRDNDSLVHRYQWLGGSA